MAWWSWGFNVWQFASHWRLHLKTCIWWTKSVALSYGHAFVPEFCVAITWGSGISNSLLKEQAKCRYEGWRVSLRYTVSRRYLSNLWLEPPVGHGYSPEWGMPVGGHLFAQGPLSNLHAQLLCLNWLDLIRLRNWKQVVFMVGSQSWMSEETTIELIIHGVRHVRNHFHAARGAAWNTFRIRDTCNATRHCRDNHIPLIIKVAKQFETDHATQ